MHCSRDAVMQAHAVLEWDYNQDGWIQERPSNQRRRESTGVQLLRLRFHADKDLSFETLGDDAKRIYLTNVIRWRLPIDEDQLRFVRRLFPETWVAQHCPTAMENRFATWYVDTMVQHYLICALWASTDEEGNSLDDKYAIDDIAPEAVAMAHIDCEDFAKTAGANLREWAPEQAGHDFWLTRNRHGTGFWDRGNGEAGQRLTELAHPYGSINPYVGDDGRIHFE